MSGNSAIDLGHALLIRRVGNLRQGMQPLGHARQGEEPAAAMIVEWALAERIARKSQPAFVAAHNAKA